MKTPTYEEYLKATSYARFRYKWSLVVLILCWIALVLLIIYIIVYAKELSNNPAIYMMDKMDLKECYCSSDDMRYYINKTSIEFREQIIQGLPQF